MSDSPWGPPIDVLPLLATEEQSLLTILGGFTAEQWAAPTVCAGWTVHDVAAHILGDKLSRLSRDRDDYRVDEPGEDLAASIDRINAEWVLACRRLSPEVLFAMLVDVSAQIVDVWSRVDVDELGGPVSWAGPDPAPIWLDAAREYTEYWVHHQQIREAAGVALLDQSEFLGPVVDTFMRALPHALRECVAADGKQVAYTVTGFGTWTASRTDGRWRLDRGLPGRAPLASATTDAGTFWRLCTRNVRLDDVRDRVQLKGDKAVGEAVMAMVSIIL
jgi:uncharacterized protein (TIGR03083 family)